MKALSALMAAAIVLPTAIASAQPAQTPPAADKNAAQAQDPAKPDNAAADANADTATPKATCDTTGKAADAKADHPSAKVGKDTGVEPTPRKKKDSDADCAPAQPK